MRLIPHVATFGAIEKLSVRVLQERAIGFVGNASWRSDKKAGALVTGGSRSIGFAIAAGFVREG